MLRYVFILWKLPLKPLPCRVFSRLQAKSTILAGDKSIFKYGIETDNHDRMKCNANWLMETNGVNENGKQKPFYKRSLS